jgi:hypothetical protein
MQPRNSLSTAATTFNHTLRLFVATLSLALLASSCANVHQMVRDDQLDRMNFEEAEMKRARQSIHDVLAARQHASLFVGRHAIDQALSHLDGAKMQLDTSSLGIPSSPPLWIHLRRVRLAGRNGIPLARIEATAVRGSGRIDVVGDAMLGIEPDPKEPGEAHLRIRLRSLQPTIVAGLLTIPVRGLIRDLAELGLSKNLPQLDPQLDELPIQLTRLQSIKEKAKSEELESHQNFVNARYRIDTPAIEFSVTQTIHAFALDDGIYLYLRYQR